MDQQRSDGVTMYLNHEMWHDGRHVNCRECRSEGLFRTLVRARESYGTDFVSNVYSRYLREVVIGTAFVETPEVRNPVQEQQPSGIRWLTSLVLLVAVLTVALLVWRRFQ